MPVEPNPYDDEKLAEIRSGQTDPLVQYFIVRKDLDMTTGKIGALIAHAAQMMILTYVQRKAKMSEISDGDKYLLLLKTDRWLEESFRKVVVKASKKQFDRIKEDLDCFLVRDAGLTQVETGTERVLALWPMKKSEVPKVVRRLRVL
jgi:peptidyl-tRNA hydrolase, PTH2 family